MGNDFVVNAGGFQTFLKTTIAQFGFFGFLVVVINDAHLDGACEAGFFDVGSGGVTHGLAIGGVIRHVTAGDEGDIGETTGVGESHSNTLVIGLFQSSHGDGGAEGGDGDTVHTLGHVGVDEFGLFGLVIAGVANDDLFDAEFLAGIFEALDHGLHELVVLEDDARDNYVFGFHGSLQDDGATFGTGGGSGGSRFYGGGLSRFGGFGRDRGGCGGAGTHDHSGDHQNAKNG